MTFVVIGGGATRVEMAGTLIEIARHILSGEFRRIDPKRTRVVLLEGSGRILGSFVPELSARARAQAQLERLGVEVRTSCRVTGIDTNGVIDYGDLATVARNAAIVDLNVPVLGALRFSGPAAWLFWLFAHIYFLIGFRNRLLVMIDWAWAWAWAYWTYDRDARVVAEPPPEPPQADSTRC